MTQQYPLILGHRGCMGDGYPPENTLAAFKHCIDNQANGIELDIHVSSDGVLIVHHDTTLKRMTGADIDIMHHNAETIRQHKVNGEIIPTLEETFALITPYLRIDPNFILNIELKSADTAHVLYDFLDKHIGYSGWNYSNIIVSSFNHKLLKEIHTHNPSIPIGVLWEKRECNSVDEIIKRLSFKPFSIHPLNTECDDDYVKSVKEGGMYCILWGVDVPHIAPSQKANTLLQSVNCNAIHGIITDYPEIYSLARNELNAQKST